MAVLQGEKTTLRNGERIDIRTRWAVSLNGSERNKGKQRADGVQTDSQSASQPASQPASYLREKIPPTTTDCEFGSEATCETFTKPVTRMSNGCSIGRRRFLRSESNTYFTGFTLLHFTGGVTGFSNQRQLRAED